MHVSVVRRLLAFGTAAGAAFALQAGAADASALAHPGAPNHKITHSTSLNWSGYAVSGAGPYTSVSASWQQPAVNCRTTPTGWSSFWAGLDGDTTNTVEQTGTEADCSSGTPVYYAWYEMYPKKPGQLSNPVSPGDAFTASVSYLGRGAFRLTLTDHSKGWSAQVTQKLKSAKLGSAEVIAEAPSSSGGVLPLADFGTVGFSGATVNGSLLTSSTPGIDPITMTSSSGAVAAKPSGINQGAFSDTWHSS